MRATTAAAFAALVFAPSWARAQSGRDTLTYSVAIVTRDPHLSVEGRLTSSTGGTIVLLAPPSSGPAATMVLGLGATDDRGAPLEVERGRASWTFRLRAPGAVRFRYRLDIQRRIADGSTGSGLDSTRLYAVTRGIFVAPDPVAYRKSGRLYPTVTVTFVPPDGWQMVTGWSGRDNTFTPSGGEELLGASMAAGPDFRLYSGTASNLPWRLAIRGHRYFADSTLVSAIRASVGGAAAMLGAPSIPRVTYIADLGRKGRTSGSLQGLSSVGLIWEPSEVLEIARGHDLFHETLHIWFGGEMSSDRWWIEGVTDYVAARLYAAWQHEPEDLAYLCYQSLRNYQAIDHRTTMTMAEENRRRMGGDNTELLVYRKGMLAGLLLDAAIRQGSNGRKSLDDVSRQLLQLAAHRSSRAVRGPEIRDAVVAAGGEVARTAWDRWVDGTDLVTEDDVAAALRAVTGQAFAPPPLAKGRKELSR